MREAYDELMAVARMRTEDVDQTYRLQLERAALDFAHTALRIEGFEGTDNAVCKLAQLANLATEKISILKARHVAPKSMLDVERATRFGGGLAIAQPKVCPLCEQERSVTDGVVECGGEGEGWCHWYSLCHEWERIHGHYPVRDRLFLRNFLVEHDVDEVMDDASLDECTEAIIAFYDALNRGDMETI
jgi:hypothetical protein